MKIKSKLCDMTEIKKQMRKSLMAVDDFQRSFSELRYMDKEYYKKNLL